MRHLHHAITSHDLIDIGNITGRELWDAATEADLSPVARAELFNRIINNRGCETLTFREFKERWAELELTMPHVSIGGNVGKLQGYIFDPHSQYHYVSVGGELYQRSGESKIKILRDDPVDEKANDSQNLNDEWLNLVSRGFTAAGFKRAGATDISTEKSAAWVLENLDKLRGRPIEIRRFVHPENGANMRGILEDARQTSEYAVTFLFSNGTTGAEDLDNMVKLYEPNFCRSFKQSLSRPTQRCSLLRHHTGDHDFN